MPIQINNIDPRDKRVFALILRQDSIDALRGIWEDYDAPDEAIICRMLAETKQKSLLDSFWVRKIL